jgi:hypothetical protein
VAFQSTPSAKLTAKIFFYFNPDYLLSEKSKRQRHLYQGSKTAAAVLLLQGTGAAGIQINEIAVFRAPDIFPRLFFVRF